MKRFVTTFFLTGLFFWFLWGVIVLFFPPGPWQNYLLFFLTLAGALTFSTALGVYFLVGFFTDPTDSRATLRKSLRRGFLISLCLSGLLLLKLINLVSLFNVGLLIAVVVFLEVYLSQ